MLNIVTVHWQSSKWIDPQLRYLNKNIDTPYRVFGSLNGINDPDVRKRFHFAEDLEGSHAEKLNALARIVVEQSDPTDQLLFLDGDAFPIRPISAWMQQTLATYPLAAVRRDENLGDCQPHPCFCFTTTGFWHEIQGDWREGGQWTNSKGPTTDVGGNLLHQLADRRVEWLPLLRTNTRNVHPLWFGVYGHRVYHHGAGFRPRTSRLSYQSERTATLSPTIGSLGVKVVHQPSLLTGVRPRHVVKAGQALRSTAVNRMKRREQKQRRRQIDREDLYIFNRLISDPSFYRELDASPL
jgi:hypothetical protein